MTASALQLQGRANTVENGRRAPFDFYVTPPECTLALLTAERFDGGIWEPACGNGAISKVLEDYDYRVDSTDIVDRGYCNEVIDFLSAPDNIRVANIVTNPPFNLATEFAAKAVHHARNKVALLLPIQFLAGTKRHAEIFATRPPARVHVFSGRKTLWRGDDPNPKKTGGMGTFAWFVWDTATLPGPPVIGWLP